MKKLEIVSANKNGIVIYRVGATNFTSIPYHYTEESNQPVRKESKTRVYREFTTEQQKLYKRVVYGLSSFHTEEIEHMSKREKQSINVAFRDAQKIITQFKNRKTNKYLRTLLVAWFPNSEFVKEFTSDKKSDLATPSKVSFKELGIDKYAIAKVLVHEEILPQNFFAL